MTADGDVVAQRRRPLWQLALAATAVAAAANVVVYVVARTVGVPLVLTEVFRDDFERMPVWNVVLGTLVDGGIVGVVLAMGCRSCAPRPRAWFVGLAAAGALASFSLPIVSDGTTATKVVLSVMHVVAACVVVPTLASALPNGRVAR